ncbi:MAG: hypothetical protein JSS02_20350 [Planctomycetes bacterium]|nr:hypothetical protein [Planctomycetota bacterium]
MSHTGLLPHQFLFRYSFPIRYERKLPRKGKKLLDLPAENRLPSLAGLDRSVPFGELRLAWNDDGLAISVQVTGKVGPVQADPRAPEAADGLQVLLDTRNTQSIHRASRYCQQFYLLPTGTGTRGVAPVAVSVPIVRAREEAPRVDVTEIQLQTTLLKSGYQLDVWFPSSVLPGFDPESQPRLGFYYALRDTELGEQFLSVGQDFPFAIDPSLWSTLELAGRI